MTDTDYADLIRRLRDAAPKANNFGLKFYGDHIREAADAIEALVKELGEWLEERESRKQHYWSEVECGSSSYQRGLRDGKRIGLEKAAAECNRLGRASKYEKATQCYDDAADHIRTLITKEQSDDDKV